MSKKKSNPLFHHGKNIPKTDSPITPMKGEPNTNLDKYGKRDGKLRSRRKFGGDGNAVKDLDVAHKHNPQDHAHDIKNKERSGGRPLTKKEAKEFQKAKKKRRFWKDD